jgi:hypothetical protein
VHAVLLGADAGDVGTKGCLFGGILFSGRLIDQAAFTVQTAKCDHHMGVLSCRSTTNLQMDVGHMLHVDGVQRCSPANVQRILRKGKHARGAAGLFLSQQIVIFSV